MKNNILTMTDSYKFSHYLQYPENSKTVFSYFESRVGAKWDETVFFGLQYFLKEYLVGNVVTIEKIKEAKELVDAHVGPGVFNESGWIRMLEKHGGKLPVEIRAVPEGTPVPVSNVLMTIENLDDEFYWLPNYLETLLVQCWYPSTVATQSREMKKIILKYLEETGVPQGILFKLHDFGYRGVSSVETAGIGGAAHLVNFMGTDTVRGLEVARDYYDAGICGYSIPACYDSKTEILTSEGFKSFSKISKDILVAQYTKSGNIEFVNPSEIQNCEYDGDMIYFFSNGHGGKCDLVVTPNHRMITKSVNTNKLKIERADEIKYNHRNIWIQSGELIGENEHLSAIDRLKIAFQSDGTFVSKKEKYTGERKNTKLIRFVLKKKKRERLEMLLKELKWDFKISKTKNREGYLHYWINCPIDFNPSKKLDWVQFNKVSYRWCQEFIEECSHWDGTVRYKNNIGYSSVILFNAEIVQTIAVLAGYRSCFSEYIDKRTNRHPIFYVNICKSKNSRNGKGIEKKILNYKGTIHCVTVPSGMLVVRRNNIVSISGNSEHSTITSWGKEGELAAYRNMLDKYPKGLVACVSDSWDIYKACEDYWGRELKEKILRRDGVLIVRPDSGVACEVIPKILKILGERIGETTNEKGYKVLNPKIRVIQGDGIDIDSLGDILQAVKDSGYSADNVAFGSGGGLLQKVNRDTQRFAFKCSAVKIGEEWRGVFKHPVSDPSKLSKKGRLTLIKGERGFETIGGLADPYIGQNDAMHQVFNCGMLMREEKFDSIRKRSEIN